LYDKNESSLQSDTREIILLIDDLLAGTERVLSRRLLREGMSEMERGGAKELHELGLTRSSLGRTSRKLGSEKYEAESTSLNGGRRG